MVGSLPPEIGNLKVATLIDLSMNQFSNEIPKEIGGLRTLVHLSLKHNKFKGSIPDSMRNLVCLEFLDLSHNNISGIIPTSMEKLQNLKYKRGKSASPQAESLSTVTRERISYYELLQETNALTESNLIISGSFGSMDKGTPTTGNLVAVKVLNLKLEATLKSFDIKCEVLRDLLHRNLVKVINSCSNLHFKASVLEYMPNENGLDGLVATKCDVYSYGVMLLDTFTLRRPNKFEGDLSLKQWEASDASYPHDTIFSVLSGGSSGSDRSTYIS
ncbi:hypothetical protein CQW23_09511 [Capsicum baccatum]|uniref:Protein kinase domain-containing protein n=1 Tax=Capsicum baccatum TaxID=33114 RepID=A0A2G2WWZ2_CAPBA|nr:hypothetical protein CQW23_09511 [Capsicum baccatum]